mmetsp:Transcript_66808/g.186457  ORF Transcript_66808/g.186457 Transcript_66808/m.186457 type:complete len:223 (+) Transcript_66808:1280-1948(+)
MGIDVEKRGTPEDLAEVCEDRSHCTILHPFDLAVRAIDCHGLEVVQDAADESCNRHERYDSYDDDDHDNSAESHLEEVVSNQHQLQVYHRQVTRESGNCPARRRVFEPSHGCFQHADETVEMESLRRPHARLGEEHRAQVHQERMEYGAASVHDRVDSARWSPQRILSDPNGQPTIGEGHRDVRDHHGQSGQRGQAWPHRPDELLVDLQADRTLLHVLRFGA